MLLASAENVRTVCTAQSLPIRYRPVQAVRSPLMQSIVARSAVRLAQRSSYRLSDSRPGGRNTTRDTSQRNVWACLASGRLLSGLHSASTAVRRPPGGEQGAGDLDVGLSLGSIGTALNRGAMVNFRKPAEAVTFHREQPHVRRRLCYVVERIRKHN